MHLSVSVERYHAVWPPRIELSVELNHQPSGPRETSNKVVLECCPDPAKPVGSSALVPQSHQWHGWSRLRARLPEPSQADDLIRALATEALSNPHLATGLMGEIDL
jgi:hypothetical protein